MDKADFERKTTEAIENKIAEVNAGRATIDTQLTPTESSTLYRAVTTYTDSLMEELRGITEVVGQLTTQKETRVVQILLEIHELDGIKNKFATASDIAEKADATK